jgi:hypothetical protein
MPGRLALSSVRRLAVAVAADYPGITVDGVAASDGEAESVELLLTVPRGAGKEKHVMRVRRVNRTTVERDLREQMQAEFAKR